MQEERLAKAKANREESKKRNELIRANTAKNSNKSWEELMEEAKKHTENKRNSSL